MKKRLLIFSFGVIFFPLFAQKQICVDGQFSGSPENGSETNPFRSISAAIQAAENGDLVKVAKGCYSNQALRIVEKKIHLLGGFVGSGDFERANPSTNPTIIEGTSAAPCIFISIEAATIPGELTVRGFTICNGERGIELAGGWSGCLDKIIIENNIMENNGLAEGSQRGGAIGLEGNNITIQNNTIRNNRSSRGAAIGGISAYIDNFLIADNIFDSNKGYGDHGGAMIINGTGTLSRNVFENNMISVSDPSYGWGGAVCVVNEDTLKLIKFTHNIYRNNFAPDRGGAVFVDEAAKVLLENELFYNNKTEKSGSAIYVDEHWDGTPSILYMNNCTFYGNTNDEYEGAPMFVQSSKAYVQNCIFWNNGDVDFHVIGESDLSVEYTLTAKAYPGKGNISADPLFADADAGYFHLKSTIGRFNPPNQQWLIDDEHSPAIDTGNPSSAFLNEPTPHGERVNLGCYGNTAEASKSSMGAAVPNKQTQLWSLSPNPAKDYFTLHNLEDNTKLCITDITGKSVYSTETSGNQAYISTQAFNSGVYIIQIADHPSKKIEKLIINK